MVITNTFIDKNPQPVMNAPRALQRLWAERMRTFKKIRREQAASNRSTRAVDAEIRMLRCCIYQVQILQRGFTEAMKEQRETLSWLNQSSIVRSYPNELIEGEFMEM